MWHPCRPHGYGLSPSQSFPMTCYSSLHPLPATRLQQRKLSAPQQGAASTAAHGLLNCSQKSSQVLTKLIMISWIFMIHHHSQHYDTGCFTSSFTNEPLLVFSGFDVDSRFLLGMLLHQHFLTWPTSKGHANLTQNHFVRIYIYTCIQTIQGIRKRMFVCKSNHFLNKHKCLCKKPIYFFLKIARFTGCLWGLLISGLISSNKTTEEIT